MHRILPGLAVAAALGLGLTACSTSAPTTADLYRVGCPAVDAVVSGGGAVGDAAISTLTAIRDSGQLDPQPTKWLDAALKVLRGTSVTDLPKSARTALIEGCAQHGQSLRNL